VVVARETAGSRIPRMCDTDISISNVAVRNHKQRSRCIVMG